MLRRLLTAMALALSLAVAIAAMAPDAPHVIVVSIDGLMPATYTDSGPAKIPVLRGLAAGGAWAEGAIGVVPSVTYPSHTTMITGVPPSVHGIVTNEILDPEGLSGGAWYWFADAIRVPTLPGAVRSRGLLAGAVSWPATVGMDLDYLLPEYWAWRHPSGRSLLEALTRPAGLVRSSEAAAGRTFDWPLTDRDRVDHAIHILKTWQPHLLLLHVFESDSAEHTYGPGSPQALEAIERIDGYLGLLLEAARTVIPAERLHIVVVSDHGFAGIDRQLNPNVAFRREGLIDVDERGRVRGWRAWFHPAGGSGFVYLRDPSNAAVRDRVERILRDLAGDPANGIADVWTPADLERLGGDPDAAFGLEMRPPFYSSSGVTELVTPSGSRGGHGYAPTRPELHASLVINGPRVKRTGNLGVVRLSQLAPTLASWFGVGLSPRADQPLALD